MCVRVFISINPALIPVYSSRTLPKGFRTLIHPRLLSKLYSSDVTVNLDKRDTRVDVALNPKLYHFDDAPFILNVLMCRNTLNINFNDKPLWRRFKRLI